MKTPFTFPDKNVIMATNFCEGMARTVMINDALPEEPYLMGLGISAGASVQKVRYHWQVALAGQIDGEIVGLSWPKMDRLYLATKGNVYVSRDTGHNFQEIYTGGPHIRGLYGCRKGVWAWGDAELLIVDAGLTTLFETLVAPSAAINHPITALTFDYPLQGPKRPGWLYVVLDNVIYRGRGTCPKGRERWIQYSERIDAKEVSHLIVTGKLFAITKDERLFEADLVDPLLKPVELKEVDL